MTEQRYQKIIKEQKTKKALIICNGEHPPDFLLLRLWEEADFKVAADGGTNHLLRFGLIPDAVVGDFDSIKPEIKNSLPASIFYKISEQNTNDADKAVRHCINKGFSEIYLIGADGYRQDQFLSNLEILLKYLPLARLILWTKLERMEFIIDSWEEDLPKGSTISLLPLFGGAENVVTHGLKFNIDNQAILPGKPPSGVSNLVESNPVSISVKNGQILIIIQTEHNSNQRKNNS